MPLPQCPRCASSDVISITNTTADGGPMAFFSCHSCDLRWWAKDGETIELSEVLDHAKRAPRRAGRATL